MAYGTDGNGPNMGNSNRNRNTLRNLYSKRPAPLLSPDATLGYATQVAGLQRNLGAALALQRQQVAAARGDFQSARAEARQLRIEETASAVNSALDRGILGSSIDLGARSRAVTDAAAYLAGARTERDQAVAQAKLGGLAAVGDFYTAKGALDAQRAVQQQMLAVEQYKNDTFDSLLQNFGALRKDILRKLLSRGRRRDALAMLSPQVPGVVGGVTQEGWKVGGPI